MQALSLNLHSMLVFSVVLFALICIAILSYVVFSSALNGLFFKEHIFLGFINLAGDHEGKDASNQDSEDSQGGDNHTQNLETRSVGVGEAALKGRKQDPVTDSTSYGDDKHPSL